MVVNLRCESASQDLEVMDLANENVGTCRLYPYVAEYTKDYCFKLLDETGRLRVARVHLSRQCASKSTEQAPSVSVACHDGFCGGGVRARELSLRACSSHGRERASWA